MLPFIRSIKKKTLLLSGILFVLCLGAFAQDSPAKRTGMLLLGSADMKTLKERVDIAYQLFSTDITFDYIVVSGGCDAHGSGICEATEMKQALIAKGVPESLIIKEEKSKTTKQNYAYSRLVTGQDGKPVIRRGDRLYVVSNHWHAIPVAARFSKFDGVDARYHIQGSILPTPKDKVDYTDIFNGPEPVVNP